MGEVVNLKSRIERLEQGVTWGGTHLVILEPAPCDQRDEQADAAALARYKQSHDIGPGARCLVISG